MDIIRFYMSCTHTENIMEEGNYSKRTKKGDHMYKAFPSCRIARVDNLMYTTSGKEVVSWLVFVTFKSQVEVS